MKALLSNLTLSNFVFSNILGSPFLSYTHNMKLSLFNFKVSNFEQPFVYKTRGYASFSKGVFKKSLNTAVIIGNGIAPKYDQGECTNLTQNDGYYIFDYISFDGCENAISAESIAHYSVTIRCCEFAKNSGSNFLYFPDNDQIDISGSTFNILSSTVSNENLGLIYSYPADTTDPSPGSLLENKSPSILSTDQDYSYFSLSNSYFIGKTNNNNHIGNAIYSYSHFHNINFVNFSNFCSNSDKNYWGSCFGLNCGEMIKFTFIYIRNCPNNNNLIYLMNLPTSQSITNLAFLGTDTTQSLMFVDQPCYLSNCQFTSSDYLNQFLLTGNGKFSFESCRTTADYSIILNTNCKAILPDETMTPRPPQTLEPGVSLTRSIPIYTPTASPQPTPTSSAWPTRSLFPTATPTNKPPYGLIVGVSLVGAFAIAIFVMLIILIIKGVKDKSSEDSIKNHRHEKMSDENEFSLSSDETDVLELNSSSDDSFEF